MKATSQLTCQTTRIKKYMNLDAHAGTLENQFQGGKRLGSVHLYKFECGKL